MTITYSRPSTLLPHVIDAAAPEPDYPHGGPSCGAEFRITWTCTRGAHHEGEHRAAFDSDSADGPMTTVGHAWTTPDTPTIPAPSLDLATARFVHTFTVLEAAYEVGPHLQCAEADALADLLRALGHHEAASVWLHGHAATDGEDGGHDPATGTPKR